MIFVPLSDFPRIEDLSPELPLTYSHIRIPWNASWNLLNPLQANLGYYSDSVTIQATAHTQHASLGDPEITLR